MNFLIMLIVGGIAGWLASMVMRTDGQQGVILNVIVGIIGGFLGGFLLPMVGLSFGGWIWLPGHRADRCDRAARHRQPVPSRPRALKRGSTRMSRTGPATPGPFRLRDHPSATQAGAWSLARSQVRGVRSMPAPSVVIAQRIRHQGEVDAQAEVAAERGLPVVPPAEHAGIVVVQAETVVQPERQQLLQRGAFRGRGQDVRRRSTPPGRARRGRRARC
jgi:uncharacterized membrane protein YeaQ/YmgE (transglycosylase-associated protein family)